ncbi:hypothetical protein [Thomasclavelia spiroformis]|uniref:hypothetical protein n=1 Tax=Thomasclavelia spiroformis TaxID=29348 RepID=UPI00265FD854|nr:hypothetical protein [Thomasclavelia spiroformis]
MIFKKLFKNSIENDEEIVSLDELQERKIKLIKSIKHKAMIKKIFLIIVLFFGLLGGYRALLDVNDNNTYDELMDQAFINSYISNYYTYPRTDVIEEYLKEFSYSEEYLKNEYIRDVESIKPQSIIVYSVETVDKNKQIYDFYIRCICTVKVKDLEAVNSTICNKITVAKNDGKYKVVKPIENIENEVASITNKDVLDNFNYNLKKGDEQVSDEIRTEIENTINLFLKTYNDDINQARLLVSNPKQLLPLDSNTNLELLDIKEVTKTNDTYYVECTVNKVYADYLKNLQNYHFEIDIEKNKINTMEVY